MSAEFEQMQQRARALLPSLDILRPEAVAREVQELRANGVAQTRLDSLYPFEFQYPERISRLLDRARSSRLSAMLWDLRPYTRSALLPVGVFEALYAIVPAPPSGLREAERTTDHMQLDYLAAIVVTLAKVDFPALSLDWQDRRMSYPERTWLDLDVTLRHYGELLERTERYLLRPSVIEWIQDHLGYGASQLAPEFFAWRS